MSVRTQPMDRDDHTLTGTALTRLLEWLDDGTESHGETYLEMRRRLVAYFDRRNRPDADALADETFNRIGRTLVQAGAIPVTPPARYCYVIARFVRLEDLRKGRRMVPFEEDRQPADAGAGQDGDVDAVEREQRLECLDRCLQKLKPEQRELVVEYYRDARRQRIDRRREMAERMGVSMNALGIRVHRLRATLESCVGACGKSR